ncbi:response regulator [Caulifigura coniformis]|uniref:response regulator n=1 Tax=Caulifigura coniformis TaxID=2527983 RepID=UPI0018D23403|nr:response regulator [Caulifigura coniformis]
MLLVEDDLDAVRLFRRLLQVCGFEVEAVENGLDAVPAAERFHPDCVVSDICLPGLNGYEVAQHFRTHPEFQRIPLVALTAYGTRDLSEQAGFDRHLEKPAQIWNLVGVLRQVVAGT